MKYVSLLGGILFSLGTVAAHAAAPVVDESQNYTILDQPSPTNEQPIANSAQLEYGNEPDRPAALAHEHSANTISDNANLLSRIQAMEQEIQELRGQLEVQNHTMKTLKDQQLSFYKDLDNRINTLHPGTNAPKTVFAPTPPAKTTPAPVSAHNNNPADEQIQYLAAYDLIKTSHFEEAITAMQVFVTRFPQSGYTPNAEYWLGELYMTQKDYAKAIPHFQTVLQRFPTSSKSAPSLLKIGYALQAEGKTPEAIVNLKQVVQQFPGTPSAKLAQNKLHTLTF